MVCDIIHDTASVGRRDARIEGAMASSRKILAASAVVMNPAGDILLVKRRDPPEAGRWTLPGGCVEAEETLAETAKREVYEETGIIVHIERELGQLDVPDESGGVYEIHDFLGQFAGGRLRAGDDATDAGWFSAAALAHLPVTSDLLLYLERYGVYQASDLPDATSVTQP
jgi:8-oxo-dGTP diphosphatase